MIIARKSVDSDFTFDFIKFIMDFKFFKKIIATTIN